MQAIDSPGGRIHEAVKIVLSDTLAPGGAGPLKWLIKGKDLEKQMSLRLTSLQQAVSNPQ